MMGHNFRSMHQQANGFISSTVDDIDNHGHEISMCKKNQEEYFMPRVFARAACTCEERLNRARQGVEPWALSGLPNTPNVGRSVLMPKALGSIDDLIFL